MRVRVHVGCEHVRMCTWVRGCDRVDARIRTCVCARARMRHMPACVHARSIACASACAHVCVCADAFQRCMYQHQEVPISVSKLAPGVMQLEPHALDLELAVVQRLEAGLHIVELDLETVI